MTNYQYCNNLGLSNEYLNDVYDSVVDDTVCKPVGRIVENCMTNGLAYEVFKNFKNRPGSAKYVPCKMLAYITGCTLSDKRIHAIRLQLVRLEARVQKLRGVSRDSFMCEIFKFSQSRKAASAIGIDSDTSVTVKCDACTQTEDTPSLDTVMLEKQLNSLSAKISSKTKELKNVTSQLDNYRLKVITEKGSHFSPSNIKRRERYGKLLKTPGTVKVFTGVKS